MKNIKILIVAAFAFLLSSCGGCEKTEKLPSLSDIQTSLRPKFSQSYKYSLKDLNGDWRWETVEGDLAGTFDVNISAVSDTVFKVGNFCALGSSVEISVSEGKILTFEGGINSAFDVKAGTGTISDNYQTITLSYDIYDKDEDETEHCRVKMTKGITAL